MWLKLDPLEPLPAGKHKETKGVWLKIERMLDRYTD